MKPRVRVLVIALVLGAAASAIGLTLQLLPLTVAPFANRIADLNAHVSVLDYTEKLGFGSPAFDNTSNDSLGIITVDDYSLKPGKLPYPWPFPRASYKGFLERLRAAGATAVVFDMDFVDPKPGDEQFAQGMRVQPTILAYLLNTTTGGNIGEETVVPQLRAAAAAVGYSTIDTPGGYLIGMVPEIDTSGTGAHANERLTSLPTAAVETYTGKRVDVEEIPRFESQLLLLPPHLTTTQDLDTQTEVIHVAFPGRGIMHFSDAFNESPKDLSVFAKGALIYIGATAGGLGDFQTTARGRLPGLVINARLADQLLRGLYLRVAPWSTTILLLVALPLLSALSFTLMRTVYAIVTSLLATMLYAYGDLWLFVKHLYWLDLVHVVLAMLLGTMFVAIYRVIYEGSQKRMVTNLFGMHVSHAVVEDILKHEDPRAGLALRGKRVRATIFYSDIRGFTSMSETMTPEEIYGQLNEYFEEMCSIIFDYKGYVDKFIGDCVMAVFSAPYQTPDDARNAVISAVKQQQKILEMSERWKADGKKQFTVGMGINTGDVVMGNLGASSRMNYTVIGDNVNVAARLYNVAKGGEIIISETTYEECKDLVEVDELEPVSVKGKTQPIKIYNVKGLRQSTSS